MHGNDWFNHCCIAEILDRLATNGTLVRIYGSYFTVWWQSGDCHGLFAEKAQSVIYARPKNILRESVGSAVADNGPRDEGDISRRSEQDLRM